MLRSRTIVWSPAEQARVLEALGHCADAALKTRYRIIAHSAEGWSRPRIAEALGCSLSLVSRVRQRWREEGQAGLIDRREDNGDRKADETFLATLWCVLLGQPRDFGHRRPTWTQRLLIEVCTKQTGVGVSRTTMSRSLRMLKARRGRPKPMAPCPWSEKDRKRRVNMLHRLIKNLPPDQVVVWEDEADIDLNPRIGSDWMLPGTQRVVMTPGKNVKRYLAGAMDAVSGQVTWISGLRKDSGLFIELLNKLLRRHADAKVIHVILDNFSIHSSRRTRTWLAQHGRRLTLHFLPPYCPDDNRIERCVWRTMHEHVTSNHHHERIEALMHDVDVHLRQHNRRDHLQTVAELREAI